MADTWVLQKHSWQRMSAGSAPSPRLGGALTWDPAHDEALLFGGSADYDSEWLDETWTLTPG